MRHGLKQELTKKRKLFGTGFVAQEVEVAAKKLGI
jgi:hypothetical protein